MPNCHNKMGQHLHYFIHHADNNIITYVHTAIEDFANEALDSSRLNAVVRRQMREDLEQEREDGTNSLIERSSLLAIRDVIVFTKSHQQGTESTIHGSGVLRVNEVSDFRNEVLPLLWEVSITNASNGRCQLRPISTINIYINNIEEEKYTG